MDPDVTVSGSSDADATDAAEALALGDDPAATDDLDAVPADEPAPPCVVCGASCVDVRTDPHHCGSCSKDCQGAACAAGLCQAVVLVDASTFNLAADSTSVAWAEYPTNDIRIVSAAGGEPTTLFPGSGMYAYAGIALDAKNVYWVDSDAGTVMSIPRSGGTPVILASGQLSPSGIALDVTSVYWASSVTDDIRKVPLDGGSVTVVATADQPTAVAVDAVNAYWANFGGELYSAPLAGGATVMLAPGLGPTPSSGIVATPGNVYWSSADQEVRRAPLDGGSAVTLLTAAVGYLAADTNAVYWLTSDGVVYKAPLDGGGLEILATDQGNRRAIAVNDTAVFWPYGGQIRKLLK